METGKIKKIKPCIVKLNRLRYLDDIDNIRESILDNRMRKCHVLLRRFDMSKLNNAASSPVVDRGQNSIRRCFVRIPRLHVMESPDLSDRSSSVVLSEHNVDENEDNEEDT